MLGLSTGPHLYWITSRAAGIVALLLSSTSVGIGVTLGGRRLRGRTPDLRVAHEALSLATMLALVVHAVSLLGDGYLNASIADVAVPLASSYKALWTTIGIVAGWLLLILGLSYYLRKRIGVERWKKLHRWTMLAWLLGIVHTLGEGTDAGSSWFLISAAAVTLPAATLIAVRAIGSRRPATAG